MKSGGPPEPPDTMTLIGTGAGAIPVMGSGGCVSVISISGNRPVGVKLFWQLPDVLLGETLNLKTIADVWFLTKSWPCAGCEKPPPQMKSAALDVCWLAEKTDLQLLQPELLRG